MGRSSNNLFVQDDEILEWDAYFDQCSKVEFKIVLANIDCVHHNNLIF